MWDIILNSFWLIIPAYCANFMPVFIKGKRPLDGGRKFIDGNRVFGDGKTWEGLIGGTLFGISIGLVQMLLQQEFLYKFPILTFQHTFLTVFILAFFALFGDLVGSFFKRRFNLARGAPAPLLDQLDFLVMSLAVLSIFNPISIYWVLFLAIITPIIHKSANVIGYIIKVKDVPW
jgi:CDP-2,3-bis-(O-geranylgeranyl)-sn-glycerol synthase